MPVAAVAGRATSWRFAARRRGSRVALPGGTYSAHPASLLAARTMVSNLRDHEAEVYSRLASLGDSNRRAITEGFTGEGVEVHCSGGLDEAGIGGSLTGIHFPHDERAGRDRPHELHDPELSDVQLGHKILHLAMLLEDVYVLYGCCAASTAHTEVPHGAPSQRPAQPRRRAQIRPYL